VLLVASNALPLAADRRIGTASGKATSPRKNRVWGFCRRPSGRRRARRPQVAETASGCRACDYKTVSGRGLWLSRDPIEEEGGVNLYGMAGNDPVNYWDYLGLWIVDRNTGKPYAIATAIDGSTWQNLAEYRKLETSEYYKWATHFDGAAVKSGEAVRLGCKYKIPNTVYILQGDVSGADYKPVRKGDRSTGFYGWLQNQGLAAKSLIIREQFRSRAISKGYKVVEDLQAGSSIFRTALQDPFVQAIYWHSHGDPEGVWGALNEEHFGPGALGSPHHRLAELRISACNSAGCNRGWAPMVSSRGELHLFNGLLRNPFSGGDDPR
jgi:RHS repeat-associated protein